MPVYELTRKDGTKLRVTGPAGATKEQLIALHNQRNKLGAAQGAQAHHDARYAELLARVNGKKDAGFIENALTGIGAGAVNMGEMAALGLISPLNEDTELAAREKIQRAASAIRPEGGNPDSAVYKLGTGIGSILGIVAPAVGAAALVPAGAAGIAGLTTAGALGVGAGAGEASERARAAGADEGERGAATARGALIGSLEVTPLGRIAKALKVPIITDMMDKLGPEVVQGIGARIQSAAVTGGAEAAQEATAAILQNLNERGYNLEQKIIDGVGEEALIGGGAGAIVQIVADIFKQRGSGDTDTDTDELLGLPPPPDYPQLPSPQKGFILDREPFDENAAPPTDTAEFDNDEVIRTGEYKELPGEGPTENSTIYNRRKKQQLRDREYETGIEGDLAEQAEQAEAEAGGVTFDEEQQASARTSLVDSILSKRKTSSLANLIQEYDNEVNSDPKTYGEVNATDRAKLAQAARLRKLERVLDDNDNVTDRATLVAEFRKALHNTPLAARGADARQLTKEESLRIEQALRANIDNALLAEQDAKARAVLEADRAKSQAQEDVATQAQESRYLNLQEALAPTIAVPEKQTKPQSGQTSFPGMGRSKQRNATSLQEDTDLQTPEQPEKPQEVTNKLLDLLGVKKRAPLRTELRKRERDGKSNNINEPIVQERLRSYAGNPNTDDDAAIAIWRYLDGPVKDQLELEFKRRKPAVAKRVEQEKAKNGRRRDTGTATGAGNNAAQPVANRGADVPARNRTRVPSDLEGVQEVRGDTAAPTPDTTPERAVPPVKKGLVRPEQDTGDTASRPVRTKSALDTAAELLAGLDTRDATAALDSVQDTLTKAQSTLERGAAAKSAKKAPAKPAKTAETGKKASASQKKSTLRIKKKKPGVSSAAPKKVTTKQSTETAPAKRTPQKQATRKKTIRRKTEPAQQMEQYRGGFARILRYKQYMPKPALTQSSADYIYKKLLGVSRNKLNADAKAAYDYFLAYTGHLSDAVVHIYYDKEVDYRKDVSSLAGVPFTSDEVKAGDKVALLFSGSRLGSKSRDKATKAWRWMEEQLGTTNLETWLKSEGGQRLQADITRFKEAASKLDKEKDRIEQEQKDRLRGSRKNTVTEAQAERVGDKNYKPGKVKKYTEAELEAVNEKIAHNKALQKVLQTEIDAVAEKDPTQTQPLKDAIRDVSKALDEANQETRDDVTTVADIVNDGAIDIPPMLRATKDGYDAPLHPAVSGFINTSNLKTVLKVAAATAPNKYFARIAAKFAANAGNTKIFTTADPEAKKVFDGIVKGDSKASAVYTGNHPTMPNTIILHADKGLTYVELLHEMTHATTARFIREKPSHPYVKQLKKLFEEAKQRVPDAYANTNLDEFVAEVFSNPDYRAKLGLVSTPTSPFSLLDSLFRIVGNFVRKLIGRTPVQRNASPLELKDVDYLIEQIIAPEYAGTGGPLFRYSDPVTALGLREKLKAWYDDAVKTTPKQRAEQLNKAINVANSLAKDKSKRSMWDTVVKFAPSQALSDMARRADATLGDLVYELHKLFELQRGDMLGADTRARASVQHVQKWFLDNRNNGLVEIMGRLTNFSTIAEVDPSRDISAYSKYWATYIVNGVIKQKSFATAVQRSQWIENYKKNNPKATDPHAAKDPDQQSVDDWKAMRDDWNALGAEGQAVYKYMRDTYKRQYEDLVKVIEGNFADLTTDPTEVKKLKNSLYKKLFEGGSIDPYFPLMRKGDYKVIYKFKSGTNRTQIGDDAGLSMFESEYERQQFVEALKQDPDVDVDSIKTPTPEDQAMNFEQIPPNAFVRKVLTMMQLQKVPKEVQRQTMELFIKSLPESSFAKSLQRRKGTYGAMEDAFAVFSTKTFDLGRQTARLKYSSRLRDMEARIVLHSGKVEDKPVLYQAVVKEAIQRTLFAINPPKDTWAQNFNRLAFIYTIGFNVSSALVNLSQVPLFVLPMLSGRYTMKEASAAISDATKLMMNSGGYFTGGSRKIISITGEQSVERSTKSVDNYYELVERTDNDGNKYVDMKLRSDIKGLTPEGKAELEEMLPLVRMAASRGQLNRTFVADQLGLNQSGRKATTTDLVTTASAFMFHHVEQFNRQVTLMAAYKLELNKLKKDNPNANPEQLAKLREQAADKAHYLAQETNGGAVLETAPGLAQKGLGRVALMYKTYGIQMYYTMLKQAWRLMKRSGADAETRKQAFYSLLGVHGTALLFAGVRGLPLYGAFATTAALLDLFDADSDEDEDFDSVVRRTVGEGLYRGAITDVTGWDVSTRAALSGLLFTINKYNQDASFWEHLGYIAGGPAGSVASGMLDRGIMPLLRGEATERTFDPFVPAGLRNPIIKSFRVNRDEGYKTVRGDYIHDDPSSMEMVGQFIGFTPAQYTFNQEQNQQSKRIDKAVNKKRTRLLRQYYQARRMHDYEGVMEIRDKIRAFNSKYRGKTAIDYKTIEKSMKSHNTTTSEMYNGVTISPIMRRQIEELRDSWDNGLQLFDFD